MPRAACHPSVGHSLSSGYYCTLEFLEMLENLASTKATELENLRKHFEIVAVRCIESQCTV